MFFILKDNFFTISPRFVLPWPFFSVGEREREERERERERERREIDRERERERERCHSFCRSRSEEVYKNGTPSTVTEAGFKLTTFVLTRLLTRQQNDFEILKKINILLKIFGS